MATDDTSIAKRLAIFALLGPALGFVMGFWVMLPILNLSLGEPANIALGQIVVLPAAYAGGVLPAALAGLADHAMRRLRWRPLWTGLCGYLFGFIPILAAILMGFVHGPILLLFGLIGAVPALICALITGARTSP